MTPIRPNPPSALPGTSPSNTAASARAAFFQAMNGVAPAAPVAPSAPVQKTAGAVTAPAQTQPRQIDPARPLRPGSLLDIRV